MGPRTLFASIAAALSLAALALYLSVGSPQPAVIDEARLVEVWEQHQGRRVVVRVQGMGVADLYPRGSYYHTRHCDCYYHADHEHEFRGATGEILVEGVIDNRRLRGEQWTVTLRDCRRVYGR